MLRKDEEKTSVVSQWPRRSRASSPITAASRALAVTMLTWIGDVVGSTLAPCLDFGAASRWGSPPWRRITRVDHGLPAPRWQVPATNGFPERGEPSFELVDSAIR